MKPIQKIINVPKIYPKNEKSLYREVGQIVGKEVADISRPCYHPKLVKHYADIKNKAGINSNTLREFTKEMEP